MNSNNKEQCINCGSNYAKHSSKVRDFEYGVDFKSELIECTKCGLITHNKLVNKEIIPSLYPNDYLAHSGESNSKSLYGQLKKILANRSIDKITQTIPTNGSLLEVGCGNCHFLQLILEKRPDIKITGIDISDVRGKEVDQRIQFLKGQLTSLDLSNKKFDLIYFSNLIEHVENPIDFLLKCFSILKSGGNIFGVTPNSLSMDRFIFRKYWAGYHYPRHTYVFNHKNLNSIFKTIGYKRIKIKGGYSFWYLSLCNLLVKFPGRKKRGAIFAIITVVFLPLDIILNLFYPHGSLTFQATRII